MTTIAFKVNILAADTQITEGGVKYFGHKIDVLEDGRVVASAGDVLDGILFNAWLLNSSKKHPKLCKGFEAIVIDPDGSFRKYNKDCIPVTHDDPVFSTGSGWALARMAMLSGLSAYEAIELTGEIDTSTNSVVDTYDTKTKKLTLASFPKVRSRKK